MQVLTEYAQNMHNVLTILEAKKLEGPHTNTSARLRRVDVMPQHARRASFVSNIQSSQRPPPSARLTRT